MSDSAVKETKHWLQRIVIGLNLCPFAKKELDEGRVRIVCSVERGHEPLLVELLAECQRLDAEPSIGTTLLVYPESLADFDSYLDVVGMAEELLRMEGYEGVYQLASFHPEYRFEGSAADDAANYSNRSPYPMLHLLREEELSRVLERHPDPTQIPVRNQKVCRDLGIAGLRALLADLD
jgi:hypothetical protein